MVDSLGIHRLDEAQLVDEGGGLGEEVGDPGPAFAVLRKVGDLRDDGALGLPARHRAETLAAYHLIWNLSPVPSAQHRLIIEQIHMRRRAVLKEVDHSFGSGDEVRQGGPLVTISRP